MIPRTITSARVTCPGGTAVVATTVEAGDILIPLDGPDVSGGWREPYQAWRADGGVPEPWTAPVPPPRYVPKLVVLDRLVDAGLAHAALDALAADRIIQARWDASTTVRTDDHDVLGLLTAIGADLAIILAPEA